MRQYARTRTPLATVSAVRIGPAPRARSPDALRRGAPLELAAATRRATRQAEAGVVTSAVIFLRQIGGFCHVRPFKMAHNQT